MTLRRVLLLALSLLQLAIAGVMWDDSAPVSERDQQRMTLLTVEEVLDGLETEGIDAKSLDRERGAAVVGAIFGPVREDIAALAPRDRRPVQALAVLGLVFLVLALLPERWIGRRPSAAQGFRTEP
jgi:hypothetical protein